MFSSSSDFSLGVELADGEVISPSPYWILRESNWKAARYGLEAEMILNDSGRTYSFRSEIEWLVKLLELLSDSLGCVPELRSIHTMLERGCSYGRQCAVYAREGTFPRCGRVLIDEFRRGKPLYYK